ncbi:MAG: MFS transporter [Candidatus Gastranaerophilales bacterium]|nr:MFS transporter [Candidatus Gastranaerophilales bacterium]
MIEENKKAEKTLWVSHFAVDTYSGFVNPIMPFIAAHLGMSLAITTLIIGLSHLCSSMLQPIFGFISDNCRKRFFIFWGMLITSIFIPMIGIAPSIFVLAICLILGSVGNGFFHPQATSFINLFSKPETLTKNMSAFLAAGTIGFAAGPIISSLIHDCFSEKALIYTSLPGLLCAFAIIKFVPKISHIPITTPKIIFKKAIRDIFSSKPMKVLLCFSISKSLTTQSLCILLPFLWKSIGYSASHIGILLSLYLIAGALGTMTSPKLEKRFGTRKVINGSLLSILPLSVIFAITYQSIPLISYLTFIIIGFFSMLSVPINMILAHQVMPDYKSLTSGLIGGFSWGIVGIAMSLVGALAQQIGIINILITVAIFPAVFAYFTKYIPNKIGE